MFAGIIENQGTVVKVQKRKGQIRFGIAFSKPFLGIKKGESIAVNGVCLTVAKGNAHGFEADVMAETLRSTTLGGFRIGDLVNLERALRFGDAVGGHLVSGHVDGVGKVLAIEKDGDNQLWTFSVPKTLVRFVALKGSVAVDGISLTVQHTVPEGMKIGLIPHTLRATNLGKMGIGTRVNLEVDLFARYLEKLLGEHPARVLSYRAKLHQLKAEGF
ncbi:MAG: riboflavin synthase [Candidatus Omnitrophota bacterium]